MESKLKKLLTKKKPIAIKTTPVRSMVALEGKLILANVAKKKANSNLRTVQAKAEAAIKAAKLKAKEAVLVAETAKGKMFASMDVVTETYK